MAPHVTLAQAQEEFRRFAQLNEYSKPQLESFVSRARQGVKLYLFFTVLSLFGGIALGSSRLGGAKTRKLKLSWRHTLRWWGFFSLKTLLLLALCFVGSLEFTGRASIILTGSVHPSRRAFRYLAFPCHGYGGALLVIARPGPPLPLLFAAAWQ